VKSLKFDAWLLVGVLSLVGLGIAIIYSSSAAFAEGRGLPESFYVVNHMKKVLVGFVAMLIGLSLPYRHWEKLARPAMFLALILLLFLIVSGAVGTVNGARRWISFASFGLQPSELAKVAIIFYLAQLLNRKAHEMHLFLKGFLASLVMAVFTFLLILKQPNYSTAATVLAISLAMIFAAGCRPRHLMVAGLAGIPSLLLLMLASPYRVKRVMAFLNPEANLASSYQSMQSLVSLGNGGFFGTGLGTSTQKLGYLPMPFTDTIFAVLGEELGYLGTALCLFLFALVIWRGLRTAYWCPDRFGSLVALGATVSVAVNVIMHVGVCAKFFPTTGQPLPFVSYGGTSLCTALFLMGVLLNISQHAAQGEPPAWMSDPAKLRMISESNLRIRPRAKVRAAPVKLARIGKSR